MEGDPRQTGLASAYRFGWGEQRDRVGVEGCGESFECLQAEVAFASLETSDVGAVVAE